MKDGILRIAAVCKFLTELPETTVQVAFDGNGDYIARSRKSVVEWLERHGFKPDVTESEAWADRPFSRHTVYTSPSCQIVHRADRNDPWSVVALHEDGKTVMALSLDCQMREFLDQRKSGIDNLDLDCKKYIFAYRQQFDPQEERALNEAWEKDGVELILVDGSEFPPAPIVTPAPHP